MPGLDSQVLRDVNWFLEQHELRGKILVAVSGGPDSVGLLQALYELCPGELIAAHLNHRLRGAASDADADFVARFCHERSIPAVLESIPAGVLVAGQTHLESSARRLRYRWLADVAGREGCDWVVTGHTLEDQAETVLHHLLRGTGWRGLRGIAPQRRLTSQVRLGRPMLTTSKTAVLSFLAARTIMARHDQSNDDLVHTRNRLRHQVFPLLQEAINPHAARHLAQWAATARSVYPAMCRAARRLLRNAMQPAVGQVVVLDKNSLANAREWLVQEALRRLWQQQGWPLDAMSAARWREVVQVCRGERAALQLPSGVRVRHKLSVVHFFRDDT